MSDTTRKKLHDFYNVVQIVFIIISAVCIIAACLHLFFTGGEKPYSRQTVAEHFKYICIPVYITIVLIAGGFILNLIFPQEKKKGLAGKPTKFKTVEKNAKVINIVRICVFTVAVAFILYGFLSGGALAVLTKAINICTECIGLG